MTPDTAAGDPRLLEIIRGEIRSVGPISFARFMELALHHPDHGYYAAGAPRIGRAGDYFTASDVGPVFGRCMARQIEEIDQTIGPFDPFSVVEFGAGRGMLADDILAAVRDAGSGLHERIVYWMVDRSRKMRQGSAAQAAPARAIAPDELSHGHRGCAIAVELFDALPVHRVRRRDGRLHEVCVDLDQDGRLVECEAPPSSAVARWADRYGAAADEGSEAEVALAAEAAFDRMAHAIECGVMIVVDYGDRAAELYTQDRHRGTLLAYHAHATNERYLERVGTQDLTAHVNFSALERRAAETGWNLLGLTTQDRFLVANGILDEFEQPDLAAARDPARVKRRMQAMQLIHPQGMGRTFRFLLLSKGCDPPPRLAGAADPFARRILG